MTHEEAEAYEVAVSHWRTTNKSVSAELSLLNKAIGTALAQLRDAEHDFEMAVPRVGNEEEVEKATVLSHKIAECEGRLLGLRYAACAARCMERSSRIHWEAASKRELP